MWPIHPSALMIVELLPKNPIYHQAKTSEPPCKHTVATCVVPGSVDCEVWTFRLADVPEIDHIVALSTVSVIRILWDFLRHAHLTLEVGIEERRSNALDGVVTAKEQRRYIVFLQPCSQMH